MKIENGKVYFDETDAKLIADKIYEKALAVDGSFSDYDIEMGNGVTVTLGYVGIELKYEYDPGCDIYPGYRSELYGCTCYDMDDIDVNVNGEEYEYEAFPNFIERIQNIVSY